MKIPVLNQVHERAGARIAEFAGWYLPIDYGSAVKEVNAVRTAAGMFDVSHMGRLDVKGEGAFEALQNLLTNDLSRLTDMGGLYTLMCNPNGGVIDDLIIFKRTDNDYYVVVNASNLDKDKAWIQEHLPAGVTMTDNTDDTALIAIQGPKAIEILVAAGMTEAAETPRFHITYGKIAGNDVLGSRTGYTGEDGFEIACAKEDAETIWNALMAAGEPMGLQPCGLASRDVLRTEACLPLYGHEINDETTPVEAGLMRWVKVENDDFIGRDALVAMIEQGPKKKLLGIEMEGRFVPRAHDVVKCESGDGQVTSGTFSPTLACGVAMAFVPMSAEPGDKVEVLIHDKPKPGVLKKVPLYSRKRAQANS